MLMKAIKILLLLIPFMVEAQVIIAPNVYTVASSVSHYTTGLESFWYYEDLDMDNDTVATWRDRIAGLSPTTATGTERPITTTTGVVFDGGDALSVAAPAYLSTGNDYSIGTVVYIADTASATYQMFFGVRNTNILIAWGISTNSKLYAVGWDGTNYVEFTCLDPLLGLVYQDTVYVVVTYDGTTGVNMYVDGVSLSDGDNTVNHQNGNTFEIGGDGTDDELYIHNGNKILALEVYSGVLTTDNINQNILYYQSLGDLP